MKIRERFTLFPLIKYPGQYERSLTIVKSFVSRTVGTICALQQTLKCIKIVLGMQKIMRDRLAMRYSKVELLIMMSNRLREDIFQKAM